MLSATSHSERPSNCRPVKNLKSELDNRGDNWTDPRPIS